MGLMCNLCNARVEQGLKHSLNLSPSTTTTLAGCWSPKLILVRCRMLCERVRTMLLRTGTSCGSTHMTWTILETSLHLLLATVYKWNNEAVSGVMRLKRPTGSVA